MCGKVEQADWKPRRIQDLYDRGERPTSKRPALNKTVEGRVRALIQQCWDQNPGDRPTFAVIYRDLQQMSFKLFDDVNVKVIQDFVNSVLAFEARHQADA
jgi:hypothetical protein